MHVRCCCSYISVSAKGMAQSFGMMANYIYVLPNVETNNHRYLLDGTIAVADEGGVDESICWAVEHQVGVKVHKVPVAKL